MIGGGREFFAQPGGHSSLGKGFEFDAGGIFVEARLPCLRRGDLLLQRFARIEPLQPAIVSENRPGDGAPLVRPEAAVGGELGAECGVSRRVLGNAAQHMGSAVESGMIGHRVTTKHTKSTKGKPECRGRNGSRSATQTQNPKPETRNRSAAQPAPGASSTSRMVSVIFSWVNGFMSMRMLLSCPASASSNSGL